MIAMPKSSNHSSNPAVTKEVKSVTPKRSLTPRRRAREYAKSRGATCRQLA
jgi:transcription antitermination protein NusB